MPSCPCYYINKHMAARRRFNLPLPWLLLGAGAIVALILFANQADLVSNLTTAVKSGGKACQLDYDKPAVKEKIACIIKSSSNKLDAYIVSTTLKVTKSGAGNSQVWEAKATCRLMCDCNNVSARPENSGSNTCTDSLGDNFRDIGSIPVCNAPSSYKVPFNYATTVTSESKDKFEAIRRVNEKCDAYEGTRTNTCSSQCNSQMPESVKNIQAEVTCMQCKAPKKLPSAPANFSGKGTSETSITWVWEDTSNNETGFKLKDKDGNVVATIPATNIGSYTEKNLKADTSYTRSVVAYNKDGESKASNTFSAKTLSTKTKTSTTDSPDLIDKICAKLGGKRTNVIRAGCAIGVNVIRIDPATYSAEFLKGLQ